MMMTDAYTVRTLQMNETRVKIQESLREMEAHKVLALIAGVDGDLAPVYLIRHCILSGEAISSSE